MTYTHIGVDDDLLGRAASALGTKQKKDTVEAGGFSSDVHLEAEREHLAHEQAKLDEYAYGPGVSGSEGAA